MIKGEFEFYNPIPSPSPYKGKGARRGEGVLIGKLIQSERKQQINDFIPLTSHVSVIMA